MRRMQKLVVNMRQAVPRPIAKLSILRDHEMVQLTGTGLDIDQDDLSYRQLLWWNV